MSVEHAFTILAPPRVPTPDLPDFLKVLAEHADALFLPGAPITIARAPGRLDVMGGIADYSGALVLEMPIAEATFVAVQPQPTRALRVLSLREREDGTRDRPVMEIALDGLLALARAPGYAALRAHFADATRHWAAYVLGVFAVLAQERGIAFEQGATLCVWSQVPEGKGVSSSAALEVATMQAVAAAFGVSLDAHALALLCQRVENYVVGAPCGVMDQITAACGERGTLLALLCQPAQLIGHVSPPSEVAFWGIDSGERHAVSGSDYTSVRVGAFMGYRILAEMAGLPTAPGDQPGTVRVADARWGGYLANVTPSAFEQHFAAHLPVEMDGAAFLARYGGTTDSVTRVDPQQRYAVRAPTAHPIYEHFRVQTFAALLSAPLTEARLTLLGELMYQSHASYVACGLGSPGTDRLVALVRELGPAAGLYGAKITGGGSGGTVAVLGKRGSDAAIAEVAARYAQATGHPPRVFAGSSPGAAAFGVMQVRWAR